MTDQKNTILAIVLSALVLIAWQIYFGLPQMEKQKQIQQQQQAQERSQQQPASLPQQGGTTQAPSTPGAAPQATQPGAAAAQPMTRDAVLATSPRVRIETPSLSGSIALKGGRIDDLSLVKYRETVDPNSPPIILLAPSGSPNPFYAEFGWSAPSGTTVKLPGQDTVWQQEGTGALSVGRPVTLVYDNGEGLQFRRTIAVDENYLFTLKDEVSNKGAAPVTLYPFALISRHGTPHTLGYYILHEGLIGVFGDKGLQEETYANMEKQKELSFTATNVWLGITDKYWAATLLPDTSMQVNAKFSTGTIGNNIKTYQTDYLGPAQTIAPGGSAAVDGRLFAGAKEVSIVDGYNDRLKLNKFDRLIDWGWFYFITKPLFLALDWIYRLVGNFGVAILIVTVIIKMFFFPLANKSYASMAKMKAVQPEMMAIRERFADDKMKQQQAMMELYKKEKINPIAGCLPIII
jgi:YidC/Oxa1 family membrane protein insertase